MTHKGIFAVILFVIFIASVLIAGGVLTDNPVLGPLFALILTASISIGAIIFRPFRDWFEKFVEKNIIIAPKKCCILICGIPRSGKTSIIKRLLTADSKCIQSSTEDFDFYEETIRLGLEKPKRHVVSIADYRGDKLSQITVNPPEVFFGTKDKRLINVVLFVVDFFPELTNNKGIALGDKELLRKYKTNASEKVIERADENLKYLSKWSIEQIFTAAYSSNNLYSVRVLINKMDLLRGLADNGYLPDVDSNSPNKYAEKIFCPLIKEIKLACEENSIEDFQTCFISAATGENLPKIFGEILESFSNRIN